MRWWRDGWNWGGVPKMLHLWFKMWKKSKTWRRNDERVHIHVMLLRHVQGRNLLFNTAAPLPPWPSPTLSTRISVSARWGWGDKKFPACQEQKLGFVINQFDRAVTEQSLPATGSSTSSTFPPLRMQRQRCSAADERRRQGSGEQMEWDLLIRECQWPRSQQKWEG